MPHQNVLLVVADDLGRQLGCYGDEVIKTPNLDRLARQGVKWENAFASTASCSASRSTLYTGLHTHQNGQYGLHNGRHHFTTFDDVESAPALLNDRGYLTGIIGKVHVGPDHVYPWIFKKELETRDVTRIAAHCGDFLRRAAVEDRPFFLTVAYTDPHRDLTRGGFGNQEVVDESIPIQTYDPSRIPIPDFANDTPGSRLELAEYYQSISRLDHGVGLILDELTRRRLDDTTLVIFLSDNGPPFINSKTTLYDAGIRLPLLIRAPGSDAASSTNPNLVSFVDVLPTILDWTTENAVASKTLNNDAPSRLGRSLLPILREVSITPGWDHVFGSHTFHEITNYWPTRYLRTTRFKYHRNLAWRLDFPMAADIYGSLSWEDVRNDKSRSIGGRKLRDFFLRPSEELYDLDNDAQEVRNVSGDAKFETILREFRDRLETWQVESKDPWLYRDGVSVHLIKHHLGAGLVVPNRFDFDPEAPNSDATGSPDIIDWQNHQ